jgi:starvation-inducible DNA-binding protein
MNDIVAPRPSHEPVDMNIGLSEQHRKALSEGLQLVLADSYTLLGKTHGFHWNVLGPQFRGLHEMFEEQYQDLQEAVDDVAERIRALGFLAPGSLSQFLKLATIEDEQAAPSAPEMIRQLVEDNETVVRDCRSVVQICHEASDTVTEDLMNQRMRAHEKASWMLRASLQPQA